MRDNQVFNQKKGPHTIDVIIDSASVLAELEPKVQEIVAKAVGTILASFKATLESHGVHINIKEG